MAKEFEFPIPSKEDIEIYERKARGQEESINSDISLPIPNQEEKELFEKKAVTKEENNFPGLKNYLETGGAIYKNVLTSAPKYLKDIIGKSIEIGIESDIDKLHNFLAKFPFLKDSMHEWKEPELEKAPSPYLAKTTAEFAPGFIPWIGQEALATKAGMVGAKLIPGIGKILGTGVARGTYGATAMAGLQKIFGNEKDQENIKDAAIAGALLNTVPRSVIKSVPNSLRGLVNYFKKYSEKTGKIPTPEEADALVGGMLNEDVLSFGDLVKSPNLRSLYHGFLKYIPFSGIPKQQAEAVARLEKTSSDIFNKLTTEDLTKNYQIRESIAKKLKQAGKENFKKATGMYNDFYKKSKGKIEHLFSSANIKNLRNELSAEAREAGTTIDNYLTNKQLEDLNKLDKESSTVMIGGKEVNLMELPETARKQVSKEIKKGEGISLKALYDYRSEFSKIASKKIGTNEGRFYRRLIESLDKDIENAAEKSGEKDLLKEKKIVSNFYRDDVVPILKDNEISKLISGNFASNTKELENTLKSGKHTKVFKHLPDKEKKQLTRLLLEPNPEDIDKYTSENILSKYKKMEPYEKDFIVPEDVKKELDDLQKSYNLLEPAINASKSNIFKAIHKLSALHHGAYLAGAGAVAYGAHSPLLAASIFGTAPLTAKLLRSRKLMQAYTKGTPVPFEKAANIIEPIVRRSGILAALYKLRETE